MFGETRKHVSIPNPLPGMMAHRYYQ